MILRRRFTVLLSLLAVLLLPALSFATVANLKQNLDTITAKLSPDVSIEVYSLDKKEVLYGKNPGKLLNPASTTKVVTAAAALKYLGPDYKFHTRFFLTPAGDLFVVGEGDPSIVIENLRMIADQIVRAGVKSIRNIVVNDTYFDSYTQPGLPASRVHYNSFTGALSLNFNRMQVKVTPGKKVGGDAKVEAKSGDQPIPVSNEVETSKRGTRARIELLPPPTKDNEDLFAISGRIPISSKGVTVERHVSLPPLYFAETLKTLLQQMGCRISGGIYTGGKSRGSKLVLDYESKPLSLIIKDMNKFSNNFIAEQLVKVLGAKYLGVPGTAASGVLVLQKYLASLGVPPRSYVLVNGSGLTYDNKMSAEQLIAIFRDMYRDKKLWTPFKNSLSIWGKDGTLRRRKSSAILVGSARGKTGSLDHVKTIAGTVPSSGGELTAFAILLNGGANMANCRGVQESIVKAVAQFRR
jgi:D-alanyl-D-alanine carboxypeptidase/D-alanyl-D-alanine-endopeptidase (penicillin-binding protein 4)